VKKATGFYPRVGVDAAGSGVVSQAGAVVLVETARASGIAGSLSAGLGPWRKPLAVHDPANVILDLAIGLAIGGDCLAIDVDATLVTAHSDKEGARPTFKKGFGFHPIWAFADHGPDGTGEPLAVALRPGNAGSNTAADHITVIRQALRQLPSYQPGRRAGRCWSVPTPPDAPTRY
jgi:hypothetical protein